ncbi:hypothetical protein IW262DRAFT_1302052 [Armillaria fumosa]|nr:hypothetical protein IW262DRAFT_1302052 [Armillaria fumosa]
MIQTRPYQKNSNAITKIKGELALTSNRKMPYRYGFEDRCAVYNVGFDRRYRRWNRRSGRLKVFNKTVPIPVQARVYGIPVSIGETFPSSSVMSRGGSTRGTPSKAINWLFFDAVNSTSDARCMQHHRKSWAKEIEKEFRFRADPLTIVFWMVGIWIFAALVSHLCSYPMSLEYVGGN